MKTFNVQDAYNKKHTHQYPVFLLPDGTEKQATEALTKDDVVALGHLTPPYSGTFNLSFSYKSFDFDMDFYYVHGGIQRFNYSYVRDKDNVNKNAVAGQTEKMWFKQGDENKTYWTPFYTSSTAEDNIALYPNSRTVGKSEHLLEAIPVMGSFCDLIGVRSFAGLKDRDYDYAETIVNQFVKYSGRPA